MSSLLDGTERQAEHAEAVEVVSMSLDGQGSDTRNCGVELGVAGNSGAADTRGVKHHYSVWVPGSALQIPHVYTPHPPSYVVGIYPRPAGTKVDGRLFLSVPLPTPVIVDGQRVRLARVFVLYQVSSPHELTNLNVYDGDRKVEQWDSGPLPSGDFSHTTSPENTFEIEGEPEVRFGVQLWLGVNATAVFCGFGADFWTVAPDA